MMQLKISILYIIIISKFLDAKVFELKVYNGSATLTNCSFKVKHDNQGISILNRNLIHSFKSKITIQLCNFTGDNYEKQNLYFEWVLFFSDISSVILNSMMINQIYLKEVNLV